LFWGFPLLATGIPGFGMVLYRKFTASRQRGISSGSGQGLNTGLPRDILLVLVGWFISVFGLYLTYEFTAEYLGNGSSLIRFARFYLPGLFPVVIICALVMARLPRKLYIPLLAALVIVGAVIYTQYILGDTGSGRSRPPGR
jgi:hypothetical protein